MTIKWFRLELRLTFRQSLILFIPIGTEAFEEKKKFVKLGTHTSSTISIEHGLPQGSILGPLFFTTYISPIGSILNNPNLTYRQYADDTKILQNINHYNPFKTTTTLTECIKIVERRFLHDKLQLNTSKTEIIKLGTSQQMKSISNIHVSSSSSSNINKTLKVLGITLGHNAKGHDYFF